MKNLTPAERKAHAHAYRNVHHTRVYRLHQRADGAHVLVVKFEHPDRQDSPRIAKLRLEGNVVTVESFNRLISPHYRDAAHLEASVTATLNAYAHRGRPVADAFEILSSEDPCSTSLPMLIAA